MRMFLAFLALVIGPLRAQAEYFRGVDALNRRDILGAIQELTPLADAGEADAQDKLGVAYDRSDPFTGATRARELFRKAAENGLLLGMMNLARSLQAGRGGPANPAEAAEWLTRAAQAGLAPGMVKLADAYRNGLGVPLDKMNAQSWYERAAKLNDPAGMAGVADMMLESSDPVVRTMGSDWLRRASESGDPHAEQMLALAMILGSGGFTKDEAGGVALARRAAMSGDGLAAVLLGESYRDGIGIPPSEPDAIHWYAEAARLGATRGQMETARFKLRPGPGYDASGAFLWLAIAARHPGSQKVEIMKLSEAAAREVSPSEQARLNSRVMAWMIGTNP